MGEPSQASPSSRKRSREIETLSLQIRKYPRDLLHSFDPNTSHNHRTSELEDGDLELNLGLSLGGRFGIDRSHSGGLARASSIAGTMPLIRDQNPPSTALARASSLPEEEWRRKKELQTLRRFEAKMRNSEKKESGLNLNLKQQVDPIGVKGKAGGFIGSLQGLLAQQQQQQQQQGCSQGSVESQGGTSSGASEFESRSRQGSGSFGEARSPASIQPMPESTMGSSSRTKHGEEPSKNPGNSAGSSRLEDMPCVFTIGDGPNGRKVEGILYKYGKGEEVRIMCICHGSFFSPAEFVKHAGGRDVEHPLRRIVVNPSASPFS